MPQDAEERHRAEIAAFVAKRDRAWRRPPAIPAIPGAHRMLRQGCSCASCTAKRADWERARERVNRRRNAEAVQPPDPPKPKAPPKKRAAVHRASQWDSDKETRGRSRRPAERPSPVDHNHVLYRFFNGADQLLYVGITNNPITRLKDHIKRSCWLRDATHVTLEHFPDRPSLEQAERTAIQNEHPRHNRIHSLLDNDHPKRLPAYTPTRY